MKQERVKTTVFIDGQAYKLAGYESEEHLHRVAIIVDKHMTAVRASNKNLSTAMIAVLAALNIADELVKKQEFDDALSEPLPVQERRTNKHLSAPAQEDEVQQEPIRPIMPLKTGGVRPPNRSRNARSEEDI